MILVINKFICDIFFIIQIRPIYSSFLLPIFFLNRWEIKFGKGGDFPGLVKFGLPLTAVDHFAPVNL